MANFVPYPDSAHSAPNVLSISLLNRLYGAFAKYDIPNLDPNGLYTLSFYGRLNASTVPESGYCTMQAQLGDTILTARNYSSIDLPSEWTQFEVKDIQPMSESTISFHYFCSPIYLLGRNRTAYNFDTTEMYLQGTVNSTIVC
jgi:hypothetical protein